MKTFLRILLLILSLYTFQMATAQVKVATLTAPFNGSGGLQMGTDGFLYIADFGQSLDNANGTQVWQLDYKNGSEPVLFAQGLSGASGNDFNSEGELFQSNIAAGTVSRISKTGNVSFFASSGISCNVGINIDAEDNLYVCNCCGTNQNTIRKVTKQGVSSVFSSSGLFFCPNGITRDSDNNLYVSNFSNGNVIKVNSQGQANLLAVTPGIPGVSAASNGHIIYSEKENLLYVASHGSHKLYKLTLNGQLSVLAGSGQRGNTDGPALQASFSRPNGLALSITEDTLFVNSSIPVTNAGGRPLNPSVIRMISGLRTISPTDDILLPEYSFSYQSALQNIQIDGMNQALKELHILDMNARRIMSKTYSAFTEKLNISLAPINPPGIYFVLLTFENGSRATEKILIK